MNRPYVTAREVAAACGLSEHVLDTRFRPDDWGSPREFTINRRGVLCYAQDCLPDLVVALADGGALEAADKLRDWSLNLQQGALEAERFHTPLAAGSTPAPAPSTGGWCRQWEEEHDL
jgi:hypothetical protein